MSKSVISIIIEKYKKRKNFLLNGNNFMTRDGTVERDYIHVLDVVLIIKNILLFSEKSKKNFILNCGTEKNISIADIIGIAKRKINKFYLRILYCKKKKSDPASVVSNNKLLLQSNFIKKFKNINKIIVSYI